jgi:death-on-curing protein
LIQRTGGREGLRDPGLLASAVARPQASFDGEDLYPDLWHKASALMHSLVKNHPFVDGNKRTAVAATGIFLEVNGYVLTVSNAELLGFVRQVVTDAIKLDTMAAWLQAHTAPV